ncbi:hypothetical protein LB504_012129 [Fusarium proliferatum]|nr:hypothetical protein LB504_012129 [Fusarium proliferatum]
MARIAEGLPMAGSTTTITTQRKKKPIEAKALTTEVQMLAGADVWGRAAFGRSWLRSLVGASPLFLAPMASISIFITLAEYEGSLSLFADAVKEHGFWSICAQYGPHLTTKGIAAVICWVGIQALLYCLLPGEQHQGQLTPAGYLLSYKINGLSAWIVTHLLYGVLSWLGILDPGFIPRNWSSLIGAMNLAGFVISALALVKAYVMPTHPEDRKFSGSFLYDFFMGVELNPRLGENFDLKLFSNGRAGMMVWTLIDFSNMAYQYQNQGYVEPSLILVTALQTIYVVDFFINESWYLRTIDVKFDHYGFYLSWGCFCFLPTTYTIQGQYLGRYPSSPSTLYLAFFFTLGVAGYILFRLSQLMHSPQTMERHNQIVQDIADKIGDLYKLRQPYRVFHGSSSSTRPRHATDANIIDISILSQVISVDTAQGTCLVEPNVPMDRLVEATMPYGLVPPVVMEFPGITAGGGFAGTSGESSSFRHGFFNETVDFVEIILGNGDVVRASREEHEDLFHGAAGAAGTLGLTTLIQVRLIEAKKFVKTTYHRVDSVSTSISATKQCCEKVHVDYVDGILYSKDHGVVITGRLTNTKPDDCPARTFSNAEDPWFYLHVKAQTQTLPPSSTVTEYIPLGEYLFRYDRAAFWVGRQGYTYFKIVPFNRFFRWLLDDYSHTRTLYHALHASRISDQFVVQDLALPYDTAEAFIDWVDSELGIWPLWLCPLKGCQTPTFHPVTKSFSNTGTGDNMSQPMLNIGVWGWGPSDREEFKAQNQALEKKLMEFGGRKWLYAHTYYTEEQFWEFYGVYKDVLINEATAMLPNSNADMQINIDLGSGEVHESVTINKALRAAGHNLSLCSPHPCMPLSSEINLEADPRSVKMVERSFRYLPALNFTDSPFKQFTIPQDWRAWEVAWLYRLPAIIDHADVPARLIESGCMVDNVTNCYKACGSEDHMFSNPETLWNCLTLATVAMMTTNRGPDTISNQTLEEVDRRFNIGRLDEFWRRGALLKYVKCALQSCSDSKFGGCPQDLWAFQCQAITSDNIRDLGRIMGAEYCNKADPGIDYDIAGPGIIVAYLIQFTIVLLFASCYKIAKTWTRNFTLISLLPFHGPAGAFETAFQWQEMVTRSSFGVTVASTLVDLQEAQAVFLGTISIAAIVTFSSSSGTGLGNISSLLSWLTNNLTVRGMTSAGMYPLLFVQLILQKTHNRWWYTLALVFVNWVLVVLIARPQTVDESSLLKHFTESSSLERCGNHIGPRTFCQTFNKPAAGGSSSTTDEKSGYLDRDAENFFKFHSTTQAPMHLVMVFLILDWILAMIRMYLFEQVEWLSRKAHALTDNLPFRLNSSDSQRGIALFTEAIWISMEILTIVMGAIGVQEFAAFMHLLGGGESGNESKVALSKWGFGQLVAVCVWVPVILKFACLMVGLEIRAERSRKALSVLSVKNPLIVSYPFCSICFILSRSIHTTMASSNPERTYARWPLRDVPRTPATDVLHIGPEADGIPTVFDDDSRTLVDPAHYQPGGKYHSIVKLHIRFEGQDAGDTRHAQATGWLIMPHLIITAAHCVYDHTHDFGKAVQVRAFVGYNGKNSVEQPGVQFRRGLKVVVPKDWIISDTNRASDVAFIKVEEFDDIVRIAQQPTVGIVNKMLSSVVGYPCDKSLGDEPGAQMYEMTKRIDCDLSKTAFNLLEHTISFANGQSGSPVLISGESKAIGVSSYGTGTRNTATEFRGRFGTYLSGMSAVMSGLERAPAGSEDIRYTMTISRPEGSVTEEPLSDGKTFWAIFRKVTSVGQKVDHSILRTGFPFMGQVGGPIAAVAGTALGVMSKLGADTSIDVGSVHVNYRQCAARAIVAEAAMQTIIKMDPHKVNDYRIFDKMEDQFPETKDVVPRVAKLITPGIIESALRISVNAQGAGEGMSRLYPKLPPVSGSLSNDAKSFADAFARYTNQGDGNEMSEFLASIVKTALVATPPKMYDITRTIGESELSVTDMSTHIEILCHRALIGDICLRSLIAIPLDQMMQNGLFDHFVATVGNIGKTVLEVAPVVTQNIFNSIKQDE